MTVISIDASTLRPLTPSEPPYGVGADLLWRVAARLHRDHSSVIMGTDESGEPRGVCGHCHHPWPCSGRRLAELALKRAAD
jgi:hypothetical protein